MPATSVVPGGSRATAVAQGDFCRALGDFSRALSDVFVPWATSVVPWATSVVPCACATEVAQAPGGFRAIAVAQGDFSRALGDFSRCLDDFIQSRRAASGRLR